MAYSREEMREYINEYRKQRKKFAIGLLGGRCVRCGSTKGLEFDHIDRSTKLLAIGQMWTSSMRAFKFELSKCQLLCKRCHINKSRESLDHEQAVHGTYFRCYRKKCKCGTCQAAWPALKERRNEEVRIKRKLARDLMNKLSCLGGEIGKRASLRC